MNPAALPYPMGEVTSILAWFVPAHLTQAPPGFHVGDGCLFPGQLLCLQPLSGLQGM